MCSQTSEASRASQACSSSFSNVPYLLHSTLDSPLPRPRFQWRTLSGHLRLVLYFICVTVLPVSMYVHEVRCLWDSTLVGRNCARVVCKSTITLSHCAFFQTRVYDTNFKGMEFFPWHNKQLVQVTGLRLAFLIVHFSHQGLHHCLLPKSLKSVWFRQSSFQHYNFGPEFSFLCAGNSPVLTGFFPLISNVSHIRRK